MPVPENEPIAGVATDARMLEEEKRAIEHLAQETHTPVAAVQSMYLVEYRKLAQGAHITAYLPLLTGHAVREILNARNEDEGAPGH